MYTLGIHQFAGIDKHGVASATQRAGWSASEIVPAAIDRLPKAVAKSRPVQRSFRNVPSGHHDRRIPMATIVLVPLSAAALRTIPAGPRA